MSTIDASHALSGAVSDFVARDHELLIGGEWVAAADGATFDVFDPATGTVLTRAASAGPVDVDRAVAAARRAFEGPWRKVKTAERGRLIWRLADLIEEHLDEFAQLESIDNGKPVTVAADIDIP